MKPSSPSKWQTGPPGGEYQLAFQLPTHEASLSRSAPRQQKRWHSARAPFIRRTVWRSFLLPQANTLSTLAGDSNTELLRLGLQQSPATTFTAACRLNERSAYP